LTFHDHHGNVLGMSEFVRKDYFARLKQGLTGRPNLIQVIVGPRQVGKTTLALQLKKSWDGPSFYHSADLPSAPDPFWLEERWQECRASLPAAGRECLLILDEVQKIPRWSEVVKKMADEDRIARRAIRTVLLGSSSLLMQKGLIESLAGRFELHRHFHWSYGECREYFRLSLDEYLFFGGYPGALPLRGDEARWGRYVRDSLIESVLGKDVLLMAPVAKPALLRQVFSLCLAHPAEIISYQKMIGQLRDAGNTVTVASYIRLLADAFLFAPLERYSGSRVRQRGSIPKIVVLDNSLLAATSGRAFAETRSDPSAWGRIVENAVGAKLHEWLQERGGRLFYWRQRQDEADYVLEVGGRLLALEVKSGVPGKSPNGLRQFANSHPRAEKVLISQSSEAGTAGIRRVALDEFFLDPGSIMG